MSNQLTQDEIERIKEEILEENPNIKEGSIEFDEAFKEHCIGKEYWSQYGNPSLSAYERNKSLAN
tara:strand:- start:123 stop:317 length:195 start_codon:yes stop_codon:yes gene_type:complete